MRQLSREQQYQAQTAATPENEGRGNLASPISRESQFTWTGGTVRHE